MSEESDQQTLSVQIANQFVNIANARLEEGVLPDEIAAGFRHAAANFSAFAYFRTEKKELDPNKIVDEFISLFTHYLDRHNEPDPPETGLKSLIEQAKNEI